MPVIQAGHCLLGQCFIVCNVRYSNKSMLTWAVMYCREYPVFKRRKYHRLGCIKLTAARENRSSARSDIKRSVIWHVMKERLFDSL